jgi:hypothetical protein
VADCTPLPGSEVLVEVTHGQTTKPVFVHKRYGAGKILYCATDESWRWRNDVAGAYQERFWSQVVSWISPKPFAIQTPDISLDTGGCIFTEGSSVDLRAFIDPKRKGAASSGVGRAAPTGVLWRDGNRIASIPLERDESREGNFIGRSAALERGQYEFTIDGGGLEDGMSQVRAAFEVRSEVANEQTEISQNESLLKQISHESGGRYLPEESIRTLKSVLTPWQEGQSREVEIPIWQGFPWFLLIILLLTLEWWLRKRSGLI